MTKYQRAKTAKIVFVTNTFIVFISFHSLKFSLFRLSYLKTVWRKAFGIMHLAKIWYELINARRFTILFNETTLSIHSDILIICVLRERFHSQNRISILQHRSSQMLHKIWNNFIFISLLCARTLEINKKVAFFFIVFHLILKNIAVHRAFLAFISNCYHWHLYCHHPLPLKVNSFNSHTFEICVLRERFHSQNRISVFQHPSNQTFTFFFFKIFGFIFKGFTVFLFLAQTTFLIWFVSSGNSLWKALTLLVSALWRWCG